MNNKIDKKLESIQRGEENVQQLLLELNKQRNLTNKNNWKRTIGQHISDVVARVVGSWNFIIIQTILFFIWIIINIFSWMHAWDPYPFILLNLVLTFQAAFTAPIVMMSQNRQNDIDRKKAEIDYKVNIKAALQIDELHEKVDLLRENEIKQLIQIINRLENHSETSHPKTARTSKINMNKDFIFRKSVKK